MKFVTLAGANGIRLINPRQVVQAYRQSECRVVIEMATGTEIFVDSCAQEDNAGLMDLVTRLLQDDSGVVDTESDE